MSANLPGNACRLFAHYDDVEQLPAASPGLVIAKLLEEGEGSDLRWLTSAFPESRLSSWLDLHDTRLLSRRSRSFWRLLFDRPDRSTKESGDQLWLL